LTGGARAKTSELAGVANFAHEAVPDSVPAIVDRMVDDAFRPAQRVAGIGEQRDDPFSAR
jgi:hypothetical protein